MVSEEEGKNKKIVLEQGSPRRFEGTLSIDAGEKGEAEELREVLRAVSDFLKDLKEPIEKLVRMFLELLRGDAVGEDVASFYRRLKESGMPEEVAVEMTRRYFEERVSTLNLVKKLGELVSSELTSSREKHGVGREE